MFSVFELHARCCCRERSTYSCGHHRLFLTCRVFVIVVVVVAKQTQAELDKERRDSVMAAETARSKLLALKTELSTTSAQLKLELQTAKAKFRSEIKESNEKLEKALSSADRAETDLAAASVKVCRRNF